MESKKDRFVRIAERRVDKIMDSFRLLSQCSNTSVYNFLQVNKSDDKNDQVQIDNNITDPFNIHLLFNIEKQLCVFKKHELLY